MIFTTLRADGTRDTRRHIPYRVERVGNDWLAYHARTGRLQARSRSPRSPTTTS